MMQAARPRRPLAGRPRSSGASDLFALDHPARFLVVDGDGTVVEASRGAGRPDSWRERDLLAHVPASHRAPLADAIRRAADGGAQVLDVPLRSGERVRWFQAALGPWPHADGRFAFAVLTDITDRHAEEARLRRSEELLLDAQGTAHLGTWDWDITEPHAKWSPELFRIYGLDPKSHTPTYEDYLTRVHPDDRERVKAATEAVFQDHVSYSHDERIRRADGQWRYLHTWAHPVLDEHGALVRLVGVCQDVTEQRRHEAALAASEARNAAIVERVPVGIASVDPDGRILEANAALARITGTGAEALVGRALDGLFGMDAQALGTWLARARDGDEAESAVRTRGRQVRASLRFVDGEDPFFVLVAEDVTEQQKAVEADRLALMRLLEIKQLESKARLRQRMMRVAGHELKNPMSPLLLRMHILKSGKRGPLSDEQKEAIEGMYGQMQRMQRLIEDLLDSARLEGEATELQRKQVDARALARHAVDAFAETAAEYGVALRVDVPQGPVQVDVDPSRMEQVLVNLVGNALKFTPRDGEVLVRVEATEDEVLWRVADDGPGIRAEDQEALFEAFVQADGVKGRERGSGLGLFVARDIVDAHGGRIDLRSAPGEGATFTVRVPR